MVFRIGVVLLVCGLGSLPGYAYRASDYEEAGGISLVGFRHPDAEVYGGGFESGVWLRGIPVFGEIFGHWLSNKLQGGNYYSIGTTVRLMGRTYWAPFVGGGGSYNSLKSERGDHRLLRPPDSHYWKAHVEAGLRVWVGPRRDRFLEAGYREHWTDTGNAFHYGWFSIEYGQLF